MVLGLNEMFLPVHLFKFERSTFQFSLVSTNLKKKSSGFSSVCLQKSLCDTVLRSFWKWA